MKYSKSYNITRDMHARPLAEVVQTSSMLRDKYKGLEIKFVDLSTKEEMSSRSLINLLIHGCSFKFGKRVEVWVEGDYPPEILVGCVEELGRLFS